MARLRWCKHTDSWIALDDAAMYEAKKKRGASKTIIDKDKLVEGVKSPVDGHRFKNRRDYDDYLKRNRLVCVGDFDHVGYVNKRESEIREMRNKGHSFENNAVWEKPRI